MTAQGITQTQAPEQVQEADDRFRFILSSKIDDEGLKERLQVILELCEDDMDIRLLVQETIQRLSKITEEEYQALDLPVIPQEEE